MLCLKVKQGVNLKVFIKLKKPPMECLQMLTEVDKNNCMSLMHMFESKDSVKDVTWWKMNALDNLTLQELKEMYKYLVKLLEKTG